MKRLSILLLLLAAAPVALQASIRHVPASYATIQAALDSSSNGDTVLVERGTYFENVRFHGRKVLLASQYLFTRDQADVEQTVINGSQPAHPDTASCVLFISGEDTNSVLEGFTLTGGTGTLWRDIHNGNLYREGGGILLEFTSPIIRYNIIRNNVATNRIGGASAGGGGIRIGDANPRVIGNVIAYNRGRYGGGIVLNYTAATIKNNIIYRNTGGEDFGGAGIWATNNGSGPKIIENNTIVENSSVLDGGGIQIGSTSATIRNNIVWGNTAPAGAQMDLNAGSFTVTYNDVQGGYPGTGNINLDPAFLDTMHMLQPGSPCIDAGDPSPAYNDVEDTLSPGNALAPSRGTVRNDIGAFGGKSRTMLHVRIHLNAPKPPTDAKAYSDYLTPGSVLLSWTDPTQLVNGQPLAGFKIHVFRDSAFVAEIDSGVGTFADTGLTLHQRYGYLLRAVSAVDSSDPASASAYAGAIAEPMPPGSFVAADGSSGVELRWVNPSRQVDGTPLNDLAYIVFVRDGVRFDSVAQTAADTGQARVYADTALGYHQYALLAVDDETPRNSSAGTPVLFGFGGITTSYENSFESGRGQLYVTGTWDTTSQEAYDGSHALTDSPGGNYAVPSTSSILLPPVVVGPNYALQFENIAIMRGGHFAYVEVSTDHRATYTTLKTYNWFLFPSWADGSADPGDWVKFTFDLSAYAGDTITVRFRTSAGSGLPADGWYLDSVVVGPLVGSAFTDVAMAPEWNMVSVPRFLTSSQPDSVFPGSSGRIFLYNKAYEQSATLTHGVGYWVKADSAQTFHLGGVGVLRDTFKVNARWNMIGSLSASIDSASVKSLPGGIVQSSYYAYTPDSGYVAVRTLAPGGAYWVKVSQNGKLVASVLYPGAAPEASGKEAAASELGALVCTDAAGKSGTLPIDADGDAVRARELPPPPPLGAFDARLEETASSSEFELRLRGARYPVRAEWRAPAGAAGRWTLETDGVRRGLKAGEPVLIASGAAPVILRRGADATVPSSFGVSQNYPNPFNPSTTVRYRLPDRMPVRIRVLNLLGQEVATLLDETQEAGERSIRWDASGFPSGVYFCQVVAGASRAVIPMSLVK
jgi:hypothetical protein